MQFTRAEAYGVFGILYLAEADKSRVVPLSEISYSQDIPEKFLAKIFQSLSKAGIVRSHRGVRGGFSLAKKPNQIPVKDILETIQGPLHLMKCTDDSYGCDRDMGDFCALREALVLAENRLTAILQRVTVSDLIAWQKAGKAPKRI